MSGLILCPECGDFIGSFSKFYKTVKHHYYKSTSKKYNLDTIQFNINAAPPTDFILNALNIDKICCRTHLISDTDNAHLIKINQ